MRDLNTWIGVVFAVGATLFSVACLAALYPMLLPESMRAETVINRTFFMGSIPFSCAAFLQLLQSEIAGENHGVRRGPPAKSLNWRLRDIGWLACAYQFCGTLLFNINTYEAMHAPDDWLLQDLEIWVPNMLGSILFLASGYLAAREIWRHGWWQPDHIDWDITGINLLGCVAFMVAAVFAVYAPTPLPFDAVAVSLSFTLLGAICFLLGALLLVAEAVAEAGSD